MLARKCDRCGKLYERPCTPDLQVSCYHHPYGESTFDLCPECLDTLDKWLRNLTTNEEVRDD